MGCRLATAGAHSTEHQPMRSAAKRARKQRQQTRKMAHSVSPLGINVSDVDLHRAVILGLDQAVGGAALARDVQVDGVALCVLFAAAGRRRESGEEGGGGAADRAMTSLLWRATTANATTAPHKPQGIIPQAHSSSTVPRARQSTSRPGLTGRWSPPRRKEGASTRATRSGSQHYVQPSRRAKMPLTHVRVEMRHTSITCH